MQAQAQVQAQVPQISIEMKKKYQQTKNNYKQVVKALTNLEDVKKENLIVLQQISNLEPDRRCFRLIGGVLCERTIEEAIKGLKTNIDDKISPTLKNLKEKMEFYEKEVIEMEKTFGNLQKTNTSEAEKKEEQKTEEKNVGLLA